MRAGRRMITIAGVVLALGAGNRSSDGDERPRRRITATPTPVGDESQRSNGDESKSAAPDRGRYDAVSAIFGSRTLDKDEFEPVDRPQVLGLQWDVRSAPSDYTGWTIQVAAGADSASEAVAPGADLDVTMSFLEVSSGFKAWANPGGVISPFGAVGFVLNRTTIEADLLGASADESETAFGIWAGIGVEWKPAEHFLLVLEARPGFAELDFSGEKANIAGVQYTLGVGGYW